MKEEKQSAAPTTVMAAPQINSETYLGKFANAEQLAGAYRNLEREFTKKCQQLKELQQTADIEKSENVQVDASGLSEDAPCFLQTDWKDSVQKFLDEYPSSKEFAESIACFLIDNPKVTAQGSPLETAYLKVLEKNYAPPEVLANDAEFLERYVLNNKAVRQKIINDYLAELQYAQAPATIGENGSISLTPPPKPKSVAEASLLAEKYFKK